MNTTKRPAPLAVRFHAHEKQALKDVARQLGTSRNNLIRCAAMGLAKELQAGQLVRGAQ